MRLICVFLMVITAVAEDKVYSEKEFHERLKEEVQRIKNTSVVELTQELIDRELKIRQKEKDLELKMESLANSEKDLEKRIAEHDLRQQEFLGCITKNKEEKKARVKKVVEMLSGMSPSKAADVLAIQDEEVAVAILPLIETEKAAKIFNSMDKEKSAQLQKLYLDMKK